MSAERFKILQLLADGKINAEQTAELLAALEGNADAVAEATDMPEAADVEDLKSAESDDFPDDTTINIVESDEAGEHPTRISFKEIDNNGKKPRWLRIRVADTTNDQRKVKIDIPLGLIKFGMKIGRRFSPDIEGVEWSEIEEMVELAQTGFLVNVEDEDEHVQIYVE
jgi:hypothetical protein